MKLAIVGQYPSDTTRLRGGVEAVTLRLSQGLAARGDLDVHVVVAEAGRPEGVDRQADGVTVHSIGGSQSFGNFTFQLPDRRRIAAYLRQLRPNVVHAHSAHREALGSIESGLPTVVTIHGLIEAEIKLEKSLGKRFRGFFRHKVVNDAFRKMQNVILLSPSVAEHYAQKLAHARQWVVENPVHDRFFECTDPIEPATILYAGLLIPRKGIPNLLEAVAEARRTVPELRVRLAGQATHPEHESEIRTAVVQLGLQEAVTFLGSVAPDDLAREVHRATAFALVSKQETLPVAILEAMAAGTPVVASPVGGVPEVVHDDENGYLVPWGDPQALAARFVALVKEPDLRARLGNAARKLAEERFTLHAVSERHVQIYREVQA